MSVRVRVGAMVAIVFLALGASLFSAKVALAYVAMPENGMPGLLVLYAQPSELHFSDLSPGMAGFGQIRVDLTDADSAALSVQAFGSGALFEHPTGITMTTRICDDEWQGVPVGTEGTAMNSGVHTPSCPRGEGPITVIDGSLLVADGKPSDAVGLIVAGAPRYLLVELRMPSAASSSTDSTLMGLTGDFAVHVLAEGDDPAPIPSGTGGPGAVGPIQKLPSTGFDAIGAAACVLAAISLGILMRRYRPAKETAVRS